MKKFLFIFLCLILVAGYTGYDTGQRELSPQVKRLELSLEYRESANQWLREQSTKLVESNDRLKEKFTEINPLKLRDFNSMDELFLFLSEVETDKRKYIEAEWVCSHYAFQLMEEATGKGYRMHSVVVYGWGRPHMFNFAVVDKYLPTLNEKQKVIILIEPQTRELVIGGLLYKPETWDMNIGRLVR